MRPFGKVLIVLFAITYVVALAEFFIYPAMAKGDKISEKGPSVMPAGYMNAALQRAQNMEQAEKESKTQDAVAKGKENAKWSQNPNDERGQGNMGKPRMRDPYGFDKDSDREKNERGRPIIEASLNLEEITNMEFNVTDWHLMQLQAQLEYWKEMLEQNPTNAFYAFRVSLFEGLIDNYVATSISTRVATNQEHTIDYTLTFEGEGLEGKTLIVTTTLTSIENYNDAFQAVHYDAGEIVFEQSKEVILEADNATTFVYSYDPPNDLSGWGGLLVELTVSVTNPLNDESYVMTYDRPLLLYRGPAYAP